MALAPTKGNLIAAKRSRELAESGFELMDRKRNILIRELMALIDQAADIQARIDTTFDSAYTTLRIANISSSSCKKAADNTPVDDSISIKFRSVMGVELPTVTADFCYDGRVPYDLTTTDSSLDAAYVEFHRVKSLMRDLAETENAIFRLAYSIKKTQKRTNALKNIVIPRLEDSITFIASELEEKERSEFVLQKVIKAQKSKA